jgi:acyl-CoA reductase-like NAD-dependent aldehyde dehydrogenase
MVASAGPAVRVDNFIAGAARAARSGATFIKISPVHGSALSEVARSEAADVDDAVSAARAAHAAWAGTSPVERGDRLFAIASAMRERRDDIAGIVSDETGKSRKDARGETDGAIALAMFMAGEGRRLCGRTLTSAVAGKRVFTQRQPLGVAGLIVAANTPIANVAWKVFPALVCGNTVVLKAPDEAPRTSGLAATIAVEAGLPAGVWNVIQGDGPGAGAPLVAHPDVAVISFTGSTAVGRQIAAVAGQRLARVSLELGGKNPLVVCDDARIDNAVRWAALSAFSNAGQRCASASRIIVFDAVYDSFRDQLVERTRALRVGSDDDDDLGPVINRRQLESMLAAVRRATQDGARILVGGRRLDDDAHAAGCYMAPTILEGAHPDADISVRELFGPITCLDRARDFADALRLANHGPYGLTAAIHTRSVDRGLVFADRVVAGMAVINGPTYGSEPHMGFGGFRASGNGSREPGVEALDVYSELKTTCVVMDESVL